VDTVQTSASGSGGDVAIANPSEQDAFETGPVPGGGTMAHEPANAEQQSIRSRRLPDHRLPIRGAS